MTDLPSPVAAYFRSVNAQDWDGLRAAFADDAELTSVGGGRARQGVDDVLAYYPKALAAWSRHLDTPTSWRVDGETVTVEIRFEGVHTSGSPVAFDAVDVFRLRGSRIGAVDIAYDVEAVRAQLPEPGPAT